MGVLLTALFLGMAWILHTAGIGGPVVLTLFSLGCATVAWMILGFFRERAWRTETRTTPMWVRRMPVTTSWDWLPFRIVWQKVGTTEAEVEIKLDPRPPVDPYEDG